MFWQNSHEDLDLFENMLNSLHKDLKFKIQTSCVQLPFLDILVMKEGTSVSTDIYYKATDSKQYLNFNSCHPKHTKINIPFSFCTIISKKSTLETRLKELITTLIERKYPLQIIKSGITRALEIPREDLLRVQEKNEENITTFISTYNPKNKEAFCILKNNMEFLKNEETMRTILDNTKVIKKQKTTSKFKETW